MHALIDAQRGRLFCWLAAAYGAGAGGYFALRFEPGVGLWAAAGAACLCLAVAGLRGVPGWPAWRMGAVVLAGFLTSGAHAHLGSGSVLAFRYYGPIEGRVVAIDRSQSGAERVTLDRVRLDWMRVGTVPKRVRVSLHGGGAPVAGARVGVTGHLSPPSGPVEPGGFDFSRHAWFDRIGAVGYARTPMVTLRAPEGGDGAVTRLRLRVSDAVAARIGGETGAMAAAILTGDRRHIGDGTTRALRRSNLSHLLAISGMHMGMLAGFVFAAVRLGVALWPSERAPPARAIAAGAALLAATLYLAMSGGNVATQRAFIMVAVAMGAVMVGRRAITLRSVAIAAVLVLALDPSAITGPGFQMSFAATIALVAVFEAMRRSPGAPRQMPRWAAGPVGLAVSSAVAGAATAPFAAAHFNMISQYGLAANLAAVPAMGLVVMPSAVLAGLFWPLGFEGIGLAGMALGIDWVLAVAGAVGDLPGAVRQVPSPPGFVLPSLALCGVTVILARGALRLPGAAAAVLLGAIWVGAERPVLLIDEGAALLGAMTGEGRALNRQGGAGFAARIWLENDGDGADRMAASARPFPGVEIDGLRLVHLVGKAGAGRAEVECLPDVWLVLNVVPDPIPGGGCRLSHPNVLRGSGALSVVGDRVVSARDVTGVRPWNAQRYDRREAAGWITGGDRTAVAGLK